MKFLSYAVFLLAMGCATAPLMQESFYNQVSVGVNIGEIKSQYGEPYEIREQPNGLQEYVYLQRIELGSSAVEQLEFIYQVNEGIVVGKQCKRNATSGFQFSQ